MWSVVGVNAVFMNTKRLELACCERTIPTLVLPFAVLQHVRLYSVSTALNTQRMYHHHHYHHNINNNVAQESQDDSDFIFFELLILGIFSTEGEK